MRPERIPFGGERNAKNNDIRSSKKIKQQQAAANIPRVFFGRTSRKKGEKKTVQRGPGVGASIQVSGKYHMKDTFRQPTTNKLEAGLAAKGPDNEGQMRRSRSCRDVRRPQHLPTAQGSNFRYSSTSSRWDHQKTNFVFRRPARPGRYTNIK